MMSASEKSILQQLQNQVKKLIDAQSEDRRISRSDIMQKEVKQQHIDGLIIFTGLDADIPTDGTTQIKAYFGTDTGKLYLWDGTNWLSTTLT